MKYVLVTPVRNGEATIEKTIASVLAQTIQPQCWVIVSDGSEDKTDEIIKRYVQKNSIIRFRRVEHDITMGFAGKVRAINTGLLELKKFEYNFIGNLDADISFECDYFHRILNHFNSDRNLGIAGGHICEFYNQRYTPQAISSNSVAGAVQLFRRDCFEQIGGYLPLSTGGIDSAAEILARSKGWKVKTIFDLQVIHHGPVLTGSLSPTARLFMQGNNNYRLGYHPLFQLASSLKRIKSKPLLIGALAYLAGYFMFVIKKAPKVLPEDAITFLRNEQLRRLIG
ncbi:Glycosyl transferase [Chitinispirillum alkaliphilum]|nr:Glycosyl transferase [Chitinispirillum alkaliphilum]